MQQAALEYIGEPIRAVQVTTGAYATEKEGNRIYAVISGKPSKLYIIDPDKGECIYGEELGGSHISWGMCVAPDGSVYIAGDGCLYRYNPERKGVDHLGIVIPEEKVVWRLAADAEGRVYGGTYPGGKVFQYDPSSDTFRDYGTMEDEQWYARSLDVGPNGKVYVGLGSLEAAIVELDTATGSRRKLAIPDGYAEPNKFVYDLDVAGNKLFARFSDTKHLLVYDLEKEQWVDRIENATGLDVSPASDEGLVYFVKDQALHAYDLNTLELRRTTMPLKTGTRDFGWLELEDPDFPGKSLVSAHNGGYWAYNPATERHKFVRVELRGQPVAVQSLAFGDDGILYIGGYFSGGFASYNPETGQLSDCKSFGQSENMKFFKGKLYIGVYTGAHIYCYDPGQAWNTPENPKLLFALKEHMQDRPFAFTATDSKLVIGTVPHYGELGGALTFYDPETGIYEVQRHVVRDQSPICLTRSGRYVYGGTSVWGGLGAVPTETEGKLFIWDTERNEKVWEGTPVEGERAVTALAFDDQGSLWGLTAGHLFRFDTDTRRVTGTYELFPQPDWERMTHLWRGGFLACDSDGILYGNGMGNLFRFDAKAEKLTVLDKDVGLFARDFQGNIYVAKDCSLYKYPLPDKA